MNNDKILINYIKNCKILIFHPVIIFEVKKVYALFLGINYFSRSLENYETTNQEK
jgi:hypothetical protein